MKRSRGSARAAASPPERRALSWKMKAAIHPAVPPPTITKWGVSGINLLGPTERGRQRRQDYAFQLLRSWAPCTTVTITISC